MASVSISSHLIDSMIAEGKSMLYHKHLQKHKLPGHVTNQSTNMHSQFLIHGGYQSEAEKKQLQASFSQDPMSDHIPRDVYGYKSVKVNINKIKIDKKAVDAPKITKKRINSSFNAGYYNRKHNDIKTAGFKLNEFDESPQKVKENNFIKLQPEETKELIIERRRIQEQRFEDKMRDKIKKDIQDQKNSAQKQELTTAEKAKKKSKLQQFLAHHVRQGDQFKFTYDVGGQFIFYHENDGKHHIRQQYPPRPNFFIEKDQNQNECNNQATHKNIHSHEHQKIRSAKGQAFASAVLKTVNLSKISLNSTMRQIDPIQFMKRNDLFNNNHSRQTTSIPFMTPKSGTVYTQVGTNQSVSNKDISTQAHTYKSQNNIGQECSSRKKSRFQKYSSSRADIKSMKIMRDDKEQSFELEESHVAVRPIRTADVGRRYQDWSHRPKTSGRTGRITTVNESLALTMLE